MKKKIEIEYTCINEVCHKGGQPNFVIVTPKKNFFTKEELCCSYCGWVLEYKINKK